MKFILGIFASYALVALLVVSILGVCSPCALLGDWCTSMQVCACSIFGPLATWIGSALFGVAIILVAHRAIARGGSR